MDPDPLIRDADPHPHQNVTDPQTLLLGRPNTSGAGRPDHDWRQVQVAQPAPQLRPPYLGGLRDDRARHVQKKS